MVRIQNGNSLKELSYEFDAFDKYTIKANLDWLDRLIDINYYLIMIIKLRF